MSQGKRNSQRKDRPRFDVGLDEVCGFLRFLWVASGALFILALAGLVIFSPEPASQVAYFITLVSTGITAIGGYTSCYFLEKKSEQLALKEKKASEVTKESQK